MPGSVVTSLRTDIQYVVTEYGCVNLMYCDICERAKRLISIAHPDMRDELTFEAKKLGYLYQSKTLARKTLRGKAVVFAGELVTLAGKVRCSYREGL